MKEKELDQYRDKKEKQLTMLLSQIDLDAIDLKIKIASGYKNVNYAFLAAVVFFIAGLITTAVSLLLHFKII